MKRTKNTRKTLEGSCSHFDQTIGNFSSANFFLLERSTRLVISRARIAIPKSEKNAPPRVFLLSVVFFLNHIEFICQQGKSRNYFLSSTLNHHFSCVFLHECMSVGVGVFFFLFYVQLIRIQHAISTHTYISNRYCLSREQH